MSKAKKFGWVVLGLIIVVNVIFFPFLPDRMAMQFNLNGISRTASKPIALAVMPLIMLIINLVYGKDENKGSKIILVGVILFAVNLVSIIINLVLA